MSQLVDVLSRHMSQEDAAETAAALTDLRDSADLISAHIRRLETNEDLRGDIAVILTQLENLDWENEWLATRARRLWRRVTGSAWRPARQELKLTAKSMDPWWRPKDTIDEAARRIVAMRKVARQLSFALHPNELLEIGQSSSANAVKARQRRLTERARTSAEELRNLLSRR